MKTLQPVNRPDWLPTSAWPWPVGTLDSSFGRIAVTEIGTGPTLLFVHVGAWSFVWRDVLLQLQSSFRCVAVDPPGCGLSDRPSEAPTLQQAASAVEDVIDALQLDDVTLVAHDLGGPVGFAVAARHAERIAALVAINCFAWRPTGAPFRGMLALMGSAPVREIDAASAFLPRLTSTGFGVGRHWGPGERAVFRAGIDRQARRAWHGYLRDARYAEDLYAELEPALRGTLSNRRLLTIFGERNDPLHFQPRWAALFPSALQLIVPKGNHFPMCDDPQLVASAIDAFAGRA